MSDIQIIAIGGAGFTEVGKPPRMERYLLAQTGQAQPRVCFIGSASGDSDMYLTRFYETFSPLPCTPSHIALFRRTQDLRARVLAQHLIFVGGGNTKSLLALWHDWGLPALLREAASVGTVLAGTSAGAICWFDTGVTDSWGDGLRALPGLGLLRGSCCPHYDGEAERRPAFQRLVIAGATQPAYAIDDHVALHFQGDKLLRVVAATAQAGARLVVSEADVCVEQPLDVQHLDEHGQPASTASPSA